MEFLTYLLLIIGYIILPRVVFSHSAEKSIPKTRLLILSGIPVMIFGVGVITLGLLSNHPNTVFVALFSSVMFYGAMFPLLILGALFYLEFGLQYDMKMRVSFASSLGFLVAIAFITLYGNINEISYNKFFILISSFTGGLSALLDYWIWEREVRE